MAISMDGEKGRRAYPFVASADSDPPLIKRRNSNWFQRGQLVCHEGGTKVTQKFKHEVVELIIQGI